MLCIYVSIILYNVTASNHCDVNISPTVWNAATTTLFSLYVTRFGKTRIVHTSDFAHLEIHKNHREWYLDVKLSGMIKE